jgi:protein SCO1
MRRSSQFVLIAIAGLALGAALAFGIYGAQHRAASTVALEAGTYLPQARPINAFRLLDQRGHAFTRENLNDRWSIVFFGFTNCPDICPTRLTTLAALVRRMHAAQWREIPQVVFVSIDPSRDSPSAMQHYLSAFDPEFAGLTAPDPIDLQSFTQDFGAAYSAHEKPDGSYDVAHTGALFLVSPRVELRAILTGPFTTDALQRDIERVLAVKS